MDYDFIPEKGMTSRQAEKYLAEHVQQDKDLSAMIPQMIDRSHFLMLKEDLERPKKEGGLATDSLDYA